MLTQEQTRDEERRLQHEFIDINSIPISHVAKVNILVAGSVAVPIAEHIRLY